MNTRRTGTGAFRNRSALAQYELHFGPNMTPMVDVMMVLLVFFMAATTFVGAEWFLDALVPTDTPAGGIEIAGERLMLPEARIAVIVRMSGSSPVVEFGGEINLIDGFAAQLAAAAPALLVGGSIESQPILEIAPTPDVPYQAVVSVHEACTAAGFERVGLN